jgi:uncharacterized protein YebE (UPF0316 family)
VTVQVIATVRHQRLLTSIASFFIALIFAVAIGEVVKDLSKWPNLGAYCAGFAVGTYIGPMVQNRFSTIYVNATIVVPDGGHKIAATLRERGCGVTEAHGSGRDGEVNLLYSVVAARDLPDLLNTVQTIDPNAFVTVDELEAIQHAWLRPRHR